MLLLSVLYFVLIGSLVFRQPTYIILDLYLYQVYFLLMTGDVIIDNHSYHAFNIKCFNQQIHINLYQTEPLRLESLAGLEL